MLPRTPLDSADPSPDDARSGPEDLEATAQRLLAAAGLVRANPSCGFVTGRPDERAEHRARRDRHGGVRVGHDRLASVIADRDPHPSKAGIGRQAACELGRGLVGRIGGREQAAHREQARRLPRPRVGLLGSPVLDGDEPPDRDGDEQEEQQVEPLAGVADHEREARLGQQEVVGEERDERRRDRRPGAELRSRPRRPRGGRRATHPRCRCRPIRARSRGPWRAAA